MEKWEYKIIAAISTNDEETGFIERLNKAGLQGWRAAHPIHINQYDAFLMEREIPAVPRQPDYTGMTPEQIRRAQQEDAEEDDQELCK